MGRAFKTLLVLLYVVMVMTLAVATFVEQAYGTAFVEQHVYHALWFCCLWGALAVATVVVCIRYRWWRTKFPLLLLHGSFLLILAGALTTFCIGKKGYLHLMAGSETADFVEQSSERLCPLPFTLGLDSFRVEHYPGTAAPSDYVSYIYVRPHAGADTAVVHTVISMNQIYVHDGFRFYQASYDDDGRGSWLSVNYDPYGIGITYAGYVLLGVSMLWMLLGRSGGFRRLLRHPWLRKGGLLVFFLCLTGGANVLQAQKRTLPALARHQADSLACVQVIYHDRVVPFNTLARDFVMKLTGKPSYGRLTAEQVVSGWLLRPEVWKDVPMIRIKNTELCRRLGLSSSFASLSDLFDGQTYRLQAFIKSDVRSGKQKQSALEKAVVETDEKVGLILMLRNGTLIRPLPADGSVAPLSSADVQIELLYNRIPFAKILFMTCLTLGLLAFARLLYTALHEGAGKSRFSRWSGAGLTVGLYAALLFHLFGYVLRWYIGGRIPLSNGYETMLFMALCALLLASLLHRRFPSMMPFGLLLAGFTLLVAYLGQMNPQITPLMPVLVSPWLSSHVSLIMMSYALFAMLMFNGILALCLPAQARRLMLLSRVLLYPAVFFLGAGIFLGAVWANVSWGRYWAWDPKEVWALITFMVYGVAFHRGSLRVMRRPRVFHVYMIVAFLTVLMTYFGVNYVLGGMHSYAG